MNDFEKIEQIVDGKLKERKKEELERCRKPKPIPYGANPSYLLGLEREVIALAWIAGDIDAVKRNHTSVSDKMVQKMYGGS